MWINYQATISETIEELAELERRHRGSMVEDRVRMLRLLKSGHSRSQLGLRGILGFSDRQFRRWWQAYRKRGMAGLLSRSSPGGSKERVSHEALEDLKLEIIRRRGLTKLEDAKQYLEERWGVKYKGVSSLSALFKRHKIKKKTGRKRHQGTDLQLQETFKKSASGNHYSLWS
jgi:transposase